MLMLTIWQTSVGFSPIVLLLALYWSLSVRPSATLCIAAKQYILQHKCPNKWIASAFLAWNTILQLSIPYIVPCPQAPYFLNHRHWCHLANTLKHAVIPVYKRTAKISTSWIAIVSMLQGYSRQRRTIGSSQQKLGNLLLLRRTAFRDCELYILACCCSGVACC